MLTPCHDCGEWGCVNADTLCLCLHCAYRRLSARREFERFVPVEILSLTETPPPVVAPHFQKGLPPPVAIETGKTWPELIAERL